MTIKLDTPDDLAAQFTRPSQDLARTVLEDAAVEAYRMRRLTGPQLPRPLGLATRYELDGLLKARRVWSEYTLQDLKRDRETHRKLGVGRGAKMGRVIFEDRAAYEALQRLLGVARHPGERPC